MPFVIIDTCLRIVHCGAFSILTHAHVHPLLTGGMSEAGISETVETDERPEGGSTPKRGRKDASLSREATEPPLAVPPVIAPAELSDDEPPTLPQAAMQGYCLVCGDTSCDRFRSASAGLKVAVVLLLGDKFKNFNGPVDVCRTCERACGSKLIAACERLVVSLPTSSSVEPLRLSAPQRAGLRKHCNVLRVYFKERGTAALYEKLLAMNAEATLRHAGDQLVLLPVPTLYTVHISNRYCNG